MGFAKGRRWCGGKERGVDVEGDGGGNVVGSLRVDGGEGEGVGEEVGGALWWLVGEGKWCRERAVGFGTLRIPT